MCSQASPQLKIAYTGGIYDESINLYYLNARYYDPAKNGMLSQDLYRGEQTDPSTWNLYSYCANNPINFTDPTGHWRIRAGNEWHQKFTADAYNKINSNKLKQISLYQLKIYSTMPDNNSSYSATKHHGKIPDYKDVAKDCRELARKAYKSKLYDQAAKYLGIGIHAVQDRSAHNIWLGGKWQWWTAYKLKDKENHDNTFDNPEKRFKNGNWVACKATYADNPRLQEAYDRSVSFLNKFLKII